MSNAVRSGCLLLQVAKSPLCANMVFEYAITAAGVEQLGEGRQLPRDQMGSAIDMHIANERQEVWDGSAAGWGE